MKLADVTSSSLTGGLPVWNFDSRGLPSTIEEGASGDAEYVTENNSKDPTANDATDNICNGHNKSRDGSATSGKIDKGFNSNGSNFNENLQTSPAIAPGTLANASGQELQASPAASLTSGGTVGSQDTRTKPDPVFEISLGLQVKIADLGNACWVVSCNMYATML
jgi:hypothetical protein